MSDKISIPVAEYVVLYNKALMLEQIVRYAAEQDNYRLDEFVKFVTPFAHDETFAESVAADDSF